MDTYLISYFISPFFFVKIKKRQILKIWRRALFERATPFRSNFHHFYDITPVFISSFTRLATFRGASFPHTGTVAYPPLSRSSVPLLRPIERAEYCSQSAAFFCANSLSVIRFLSCSFCCWDDRIHGHSDLRQPSFLIRITHADTG